MSAYLGRINRLLVQIQEAQQLDNKSLMGAIVGQNTETGKWEVIADLMDEAGKVERIISEHDTKEAAVLELEGIDAAHAPTGKKVKPREPYICMIDDIQWSQ